MDTLVAGKVGVGGGAGKWLLIEIACHLVWCDIG